MIGFDTSLDDDDVITFSTPAGSPASCEDLREREHRQRRLLRRLDHHRAARGDRRADLARAHRHREVPRRDRVARADRLAHRDQPPLAVGRGREAALDPHRLLREPAEELGRVGDLGLGLRDRLAHLERHHQRQLVRARGDRLERAPQDLAALARRMRRPLGLHGDGTRRAPRRRRPAWRRRPRRAARRSPGPRRASVSPPPASRHSPPMNSWFGTASRAACSWVCGDAHAATVSVPSSSEMATSSE